MADTNDAHNDARKGTVATEAGPSDTIATLKRDIVSTVAACLAVAAIAVVLFTIDIGCPVKAATGISCPGCGLTRAWVCALQGNFPDALMYHPLFWTVPFIVLGCALRSLFSQRVLNIACWVLVGAFAALWIVRLAGWFLGLTWLGPLYLGEPATVSVDAPLWMNVLPGLF